MFFCHLLSPINRCCIPVIEVLLSTRPFLICFRAIYSTISARVHKYISKRKGSRDRKRVLFLLQDIGMCGKHVDSVKAIKKMMV